MTYLDVARDEYFEALLYYKQHSLNAAVGFEVALETVENLLCEFPGVGHNLENFPEVKFFSLKNYPYTIYYRTDHDALEVVAISLFNNNRNPKRLEQLLKMRLS
jgi:plasmid stabilization system protein ParE